MELLGEEEQVGGERIAMENVDQDDQEIVRTAKNIIAFFNRNTLYSRLRKGLILRKFY